MNSSVLKDQTANDLKPCIGAKNEREESEQPADDFVVGDWVVSPQLNQLLHRNTAITRHLEPRLTRLLCCLASHPMQVVDRNTLTRTLWPRVIVNENSLTRAVSELRKYLSVNGHSGPVYIETIPKRGYRLCLPVSRSDSNAVSTTAPAQDPDSRTPWRFPISLIALHNSTGQSVLAACCLCLIFAGWLHYSETVPDYQGDVRFVDEIVNTGENNFWQKAGLQDELVSGNAMGTAIVAERLPQYAFSQYQDRFAYIQYDHNGSTLFLGKLGSNTAPVAIFSSTEFLSNLTWSPLGSALLFARQPAQTGTALFEQAGASGAELFSFDLETFKLSRLVEKSAAEAAAAVTGDRLI